MNATRLFVTLTKKRHNECCFVSAGCVKTGRELFKTSEARRARCAKALFFPDQTKLIIAALRTLSATKLQGRS